MALYILLTVTITGTILGFVSAINDNDDGALLVMRVNMYALASVGISLVVVFGMVMFESLDRGSLYEEMSYEATVPVKDISLNSEKLHWTALDGTEDEKKFNAVEFAAPEDGISETKIDKYSVYGKLTGIKYTKAVVTFGNVQEECLVEESDAA